MILPVLSPPSTSFTILQVFCYVEDDGAMEDGYEEIYSTSYNFSNGERVYPNNNGTLQTNGSLDDIMTVELAGSLNETSEDGNVVELLISADFDVVEPWVVLLTSSDLTEAVPVSSVGMLTTTFVRMQFDEYHNSYQSVYFVGQYDGEDDGDVDYLAEVTLISSSDSDHYLITTGISMNYPLSNLEVSFLI